MCISALSSSLCLADEGEEETEAVLTAPGAAAAYRASGQTVSIPSLPMASQGRRQPYYITADGHADAGRPAAAESLLRAPAQASVPGVSQTEALQLCPNKTAARPLKWTLNVPCIHLQPTWCQELPLCPIPLAATSNSSAASVGSRSPIMTVGLQIPKEDAQVAPFVVQMMALAPLLGWAQSVLGQDAFQQVLSCLSRA